MRAGIVPDAPAKTGEVVEVEPLPADVAIEVKMGGKGGGIRDALLVLLLLDDEALCLFTFSCLFMFLLV